MKRLVVPVVFLACGLATVAARTAQAPAMGSIAVTWEEIMAKGTGGRAHPVFQAPTATLDELEMHVTILPPHTASHPPHQHPDEEIIVIREGTLDAMVNGTTRRVGPGSVIFEASNQPHGLTNVGDTPASYHVIRWSSPGMLKAKDAK
jgi:XRE family transcriptional regulator, regulator of sulfur utilization